MPTVRDDPAVVAAELSLRRLSVKKQLGPVLQPDIEEMEKLYERAMRRIKEAGGQYSTGDQ